MHLESRGCLLGRNINTRTETHGDEDVPAIDIPIKKFALTEAELNEIAGDQYAYRALYDTSKSPVEPIFKRFKPLAMMDKFEGSSATILVGLRRKQLTFENCKIASIRLEPLTGGITSMSFTIQVNPDVDVMPHLMKAMNHGVEISLELGDRVEKGADKQGSLDLGGAEEPDGDESRDDDEREAA